MLLTQMFSFFLWALGSGGAGAPQTSGQGTEMPPLCSLQIPRVGGGRGGEFCCEKWPSSLISGSWIRKSFP